MSELVQARGRRDEPIDGLIDGLAESGAHTSHEMT